VVQSLRVSPASHCAERVTDAFGQMLAGLEISCG
jgi:hypothetical protein